TRSFHRDLNLDPADRSWSGRGVSCRLRLDASDRRFLVLSIGGAADRPPERWEAEVPELDPRRALEGTSEPARRLRGLIDPALVRPRLELEIERWARPAASGWFSRTPRFLFLYDACTVRNGGLARGFWEVQVRRLRSGGPRLEEIAAALERNGLRPTATAKVERAAALIDAMAAEATARLVASQRAVALLAYDGDRVAFHAEADEYSLPVARGSGEEACRHLLRHLFDSGVGDLTLLGHTAGTDDRPALEVWLARKIRADADRPASGFAWLRLAEALQFVGTARLRSAETLGALALAARLDLGSGRPPARPSAAAALEVPPERPRPPRVAARARTDLPPDRFLNVELSQVAFHERVLELGLDPAEPLAERLRYLAIVASNLDEFFSVRVGALKLQLAERDPARSLDGLSAAEQLDAIGARVPQVTDRLARGARDCLAAVASRGWRVRQWAELDPAARDALTRHFRSELLPLLTPRAVTLSPGHPFPVIPHLTLAFAVVVQDVHTGPVHFAYLAIPARLPRFLPVPGSPDLIPIEAVVRANLDACYPERPIAAAWLFRVTRGADLDMNEEDAGDLLQAIEEEVARRPLNAAVRIEVERGMSPEMRELLLRELRFERRHGGTVISDADVYPVEGLLDLTCLRDLAARLPAEDQFPRVASRDPFAEVEGLLDELEYGDRLVHHPFEAFDRTVGRFLEEAAADPAVAAIKMTLYRIGEESRLVDALVAAARAGKEVAVFVELKARFDEARNARWVRRLEEAGAQVIYGIVGLKIHAKLALVVREGPGGVRRYAHVATGNYNAGTARFYTDLGLFTADPEITADVGDLFNQLTGSTAPPAGSTRRLLVSPHGTLPGLLELIEGEIRHVEAGRPGLFRAQVNGLEDPEIVAALYRAAAAGVKVDLVVRGLCVLRPGVEGLSSGIRVRSVLGRFLEHQRIFHVHEGGLDRYYIGSADLRPRNLRRRVEVLCPVQKRDLKARLARLLDELLAEPFGWDLAEDGRYRRAVPSPRPVHLHHRLAGLG
ncbi:MAG: polyphosphate kinase 1, partial [Gemmatimonadales bacterium]